MLAFVHFLVAIFAHLGVFFATGFLSFNTVAVTAKVVSKPAAPMSRYFFIENNLLS
jgi:hypothetical protein